jgi:hypothetical protein
VRILRRSCTAAAGVLLFAACDDDPAQPSERLALQSCPVVTDVNAPIALQFTTAVLSSTVGGGSVVVSSAETGLEIPGTATVDPTNPSRVLFVSSAPLAFDQPVRLRVQNLRATASGTQIDVTVCEFRTPLPPITQLWWTALPSASGNRILSAALVSAEKGFALSESGVLSEGGQVGEDFVVVYQEPRFLAGFDIDFISPTRGFATMSNFRRGRTELLESNNGGVTFDSVGSVLGDNLTRIRFLPTTGAAPNNYFNAIGGGSTFQTSFYKFLPATRTFRSQLFVSGTATPPEQQSGQVQDLDVRLEDTTRLAAVTAGVRVGTIDVRGQLYVSKDGGSTWARVPTVRVNNRVQTLWGVSVRPDGDIWISGGNGFVARVSGAFGTGTVTIDSSTTATLRNGTGTGTANNGVRSQDETNPNALIYTDVQFAPDDASRGWLIGAQLVGIDAGIPRYQGLIFETRDGGATWTRQGVLGANNYGAEFPRINRIEVFSSQAVWLVGEGGTVLRYTPQATTATAAQP